MYLFCFSFWRGLWFIGVVWRFIDSTLVSIPFKFLIVIFRPNFAAPLLYSLVVIKMTWGSLLKGSIFWKGCVIISSVLLILVCLVSIFLFRMLFLRLVPLVLFNFVAKNWFAFRKTWAVHLFFIFPLQPYSHWHFWTVRRVWSFPFVFGILRHQILVRVKWMRILWPPMIIPTSFGQISLDCDRQKHFVEFWQAINLLQNLILLLLWGIQIVVNFSNFFHLIFGYKKSFVCFVDFANFVCHFLVCSLLRPIFLASTFGQIEIWCLLWRSGKLKLFAFTLYCVNFLLKFLKFFFQMHQILVPLLHCQELRPMGHLSELLTDIFLFDSVQLHNELSSSFIFLYIRFWIRPLTILGIKCCLFFLIFWVCLFSVWRVIFYSTFRALLFAIELEMVSEREVVKAKLLIRTHSSTVIVNLIHVAISHSRGFLLSGDFLWFRFEPGLTVDFER